MARPRSTANFISYDLRPAKQTERRIILDILKIGGDSGLPIPEYRYIGMGANRFYDFQLIHKYIGISSMISLEHDRNMFKRAEFNCPYGFIEVKNLTSESFINQDDFNEPSVIWFDYDGGIGESVINDISSLSTKLRVGDFCFVTLFGGPSGALRDMNVRERYAWFQEVLGDVAGNVREEDLQNSTFSEAIFKTLSAAFTNAFSFRPGARFLHLLKIQYKDSKLMITVGGVLLSEEMIPGFIQKFNQAFPFLRSGDVYEIASFNLTEREKVLFDMASTAKPKLRAHKNSLRKLGFESSDIEAYKELIRYLPRYVETIF